MIFSKEDSGEFNDPRKVGITAIISFGTMTVPVLGGILILLAEINLFNFGLLIGYIIVGIVPNFFIRGSICDKCMQEELGCPAYERMMKVRE
jgi:hypothetical protein